MPVHSLKIYHSKETYKSHRTHLPNRASAADYPLARGPFLLAPGERASVNVEPCVKCHLSLKIDISQKYILKSCSVNIKLGLH